jgi:predicted MPP superfamily phosphohydrolase
VDLQLSGHTHGGQVCIPVMGPLITLSKFGTRYAAGLNKGPVSPVLTSRGIGMSILPIRFCCPPELVEVTLVRAAP